MFSFLCVLLVVFSGLTHAASCPTFGYASFLPGVVGAHCEDPPTITVSVEFNVCYVSSVTCHAPCDTSCCTGDFADCLVCTGCIAHADSSFKVVNGTWYSYFYGDTTCSGVSPAQYQYPYACAYTNVDICGNNLPSFNNVTYLSNQYCDPAHSTTSTSTFSLLTSSASLSSTSSSTDLTSTSGSDNDAGGRSDLSSAGEIYIALDF